MPRRRVGIEFLSWLQSHEDNVPLVRPVVPELVISSMEVVEDAQHPVALVEPTERERNGYTPALLHFTILQKTKYI